MPPFNEARRDRLADAAMEILAREGARGLTHRAVDAEAGEPLGTTSRYFRTRDALLQGVVARARALHLADLSAAAADGEPLERLHLIVESALTVHRSRHLAMIELFVESTRRPGLRAAMAEARAAQLELIQRIFTGLTGKQASIVQATLTGLVFIGLTS